MCKFSSRLFVFLVVVPLLGVMARPVAKRSILDLLSPTDNDYNLKYDQRQKGGENFRLKMDGVFIGLPAEPTSLLLLTDELVNVLGEELLLGRHGEGQSPIVEPNVARGPMVQNPELVQKQLENYQNEAFDKAEGEVPSQRATSELRDDFSQGSRTKLYVMNLLDFIRRNRHS